MRRTLRAEEWGAPWLTKAWGRRVAVLVTLGAIGIGWLGLRLLRSRSAPLADVFAGAALLGVAATSIFVLQNAPWGTFLLTGTTRHLRRAARAARRQTRAGDGRALQAQADGSWCGLRGRVVGVGAAMPELTARAGAVYRRIGCVYRQPKRWYSNVPHDHAVVHEFAVAFDVVDEHGQRAAVRAEALDVLVSAPRLARPTGDIGELHALPIPDLVRRRLQTRRHPDLIFANEVCVFEGDEVEVYGLKTRAHDPARPQLERDDVPTMPVLQATKDRPVLLILISACARPEPRATPAR